MTVATAAGLCGEVPIDAGKLKSFRGGAARRIYGGARFGCLAWLRNYTLSESDIGV
jgi:hypothetical protein